MTASNASVFAQERKDVITSRKNAHKWTSWLIVFLSCCIFAHFIFLLLQSSNFTSIGTMSILREYNKDKMDHEKARELEFWVHRYVRWHKANRHNASRLAVFLSVRAGLGDNVHGMLNLWGYAVLTNRLFLVGPIWPYPLHPTLSEATKLEFIYNLRQDRKFGPLVGARMLVPNKGELLPHTIDLLKGPTHVAALHLAGAESPHEVALRLPRYIHNSEETYTLPNFSRSVKSAITKLLLDPSDELLQLKNSFLSQHGLDDGKPYFGYHARLGTGVNEQGNRRFANISYNYISECAADKQRQIAGRYRIEP